MIKVKRLYGKMTRMKLNEAFSMEFIEGLKAGMNIAKEVAERQGYEIIFPDVDEMVAEKVKDDKK